jgi:hypothetical protein
MISGKNRLRISRRDFLRHVPVAGCSALSFGSGLWRSPDLLRAAGPQLTPSDAVRNTLPFSLVDVAAGAGLAGAVNVFGGIASKRYLLEETGCGIAFFDYDHDGWLDIFLVNGTRFGSLPPGPPPSSRLFHNNRDGTFTDVTERAGLVRSGWGQGCCVGDYDNDGHDDLFVTYWGENVLYHNNGDGTFTDVTLKAGLLQTGSKPRWNTGCCFVDYDRDGQLDLFVANYVNFDPRVAPLPGDSLYCRYFGIPVACGPQGLGGGTNILYHNRGDGTFEDVSEASGITNPHGLLSPTYVRSQWIPVGSYGFTACAADFDNDGWPDIYVACDTVASRLYHNNHDGTFTEIATQAGCAFNEDGVPQGGMGVAVGDYDCDGWLDIVKTNFSEQTANLYHNNGDGTFYDAVFRAGLGINTRYLGWGVGLVDLDNDGWADIFMSNGHVFPEVASHPVPVTYKQRKIVYRNLGNGHFADVSSLAGPGVTALHCSRGTAFGDFDNDGDIDAVVCNMNEPPSLLRNDCRSGNHWLKVKCLGLKSNCTGIGARVRVVTGSHSQIAEVMSGSSYISQNDFRLHFGLGKSSHADRIEVRWPSGIIDSVTQVEANQLIFIQEGRGMIRATRFR